MANFHLVCLADCFLYKTNELIMANTKEYKVNSIGHWQGLEELLNTVHGF